VCLRGVSSGLSMAQVGQGSWPVSSPAGRPALVVVALLVFMGAWNDYLGPLVYINRDAMYPLALAINQLRSTLAGVGISPLAYPYLMAISTVAIMLIVAGFFFAQRTFIEGISLTGLKG